ncbi:fragile X messenger ribonucleoprotein 1 homolog B-like [Sycon ciliatum]|uniref:fragile X messenger ribonucleoprotein 1 homolog B-like n=1 Tax=Sycon ciliatum TaxID=27933 RepID=UPI0031F65F5D
MASYDNPSSGAYYGDLEVEVKAGNGNDSYFKAFIVDIFENEVVVAYEDEWQSRRKVPLADVRLPDNQGMVNLKVGDNAEVFSRVKKSEPCSYWQCRIVQQKGEFFVIEYTGLDANFANEIVERDRLRLPNHNPPIASKSFYKCIIELPDSLRDVCEDMSLHRDLLKACNARMIIGDKFVGTLTMLSQSEDLIYRAEMLADIHVRSLPTKVLLKQRAAGKQTTASESPQPTDSANSTSDYMTVEEAPLYPYTDEFTVAEDLLGLSIGSRGSNLSAAKAIRGVLSVELNDSNSTFYIGGETKEAVDQARHHLEYLKIATFIPQAFTGRMIGKGGAKMQEIVDQSSVIRGSTELVNGSGDVPFVFVGRRKCVDHARLLLDYHFLLMKELDDLSTVRARDAPTQSFRRSWFPSSSRNDRGNNYSAGNSASAADSHGYNSRRHSDYEGAPRNTGRRGGGGSGRGGGASRGNQQARGNNSVEGHTSPPYRRDSEDQFGGASTGSYRPSQSSQVSFESVDEFESAGLASRGNSTNAGRGRRQQQFPNSAPPSTNGRDVSDGRGGAGGQSQRGKGYRTPLESVNQRRHNGGKGNQQQQSSRNSQADSQQSSVGSAPTSRANSLVPTDQEPNRDVAAASASKPLSQRPQFQQKQQQQQRQQQQAQPAQQAQQQQKQQQQSQQGEQKASGQKSRAPRVRNKQHQRSASDRPGKESGKGTANGGGSGGGQQDKLSKQTEQEQQKPSSPRPARTNSATPSVTPSLPAANSTAAAAAPTGSSSSAAAAGVSASSSSTSVSGKKSSGKSSPTNGPSSSTAAGSSATKDTAKDQGTSAATQS